MKASKFKSNLIVMTLTLLFLLGPGTGKAQGDVKIRGKNLPPDVLQVVDSHFQNPNKSIDGIQFRDLSLSLDEAAALFLSTDPDENLLRLIGETIANDREVRFRGTVDGSKFEAQVERHDDGTLRARIKGLDIANLAPEQLGEFLSNGFDRLRIRGTKGERFEIRRQNDGNLTAKIKGMNLSGITAEQLANLAVENGFDRLHIKGSQGEQFQIKQQGQKALKIAIKGINLDAVSAEKLTSLAVDKGLDRLRINGTGGQSFDIKRNGDGTFRAKIYGLDLNGISAERISNLVVDNGLNRLRIRGLDGERLEFKRQDNGTLRAAFERMDLSNRDPKKLLESLRAQGLDRVKIEGTGKNGNEMRIEFRSDKGVVRLDGVGRGLAEFNRATKAEQSLDRSRDLGKKIRNRIDREKQERFGSGNSRGRGSDRMGVLRERAERFVRDKVDR